MTLSNKCPHCGARDLAHALWQSVCTGCGKWSGVEPAQPAEVPDNRHGGVDIDTPVADHSNLISALRPPVQSTTPPEYVRPAPVPEPPAPPAEAPVAE